MKLRMLRFQNYTRVLFFPFITMGICAKSRSIECDEITDKMLSSRDL